MRTEKPEMTIFINTCDSYEDCWNPFFQLFNKYWRHCPYPIVLNTELKSYKFKNLNITCSRVQLNEDKKLNWSECLAKALSKIKSPYILYLQEDYFLEGNVKNKIIKKLLLNLSDGYADSIRLLEGPSSGPWKKIKGSNDIWEIEKKSKYLLSLQASIWKTEVLKKQIRTHENGWQFESYGSSRIRRGTEKICCVNRDLYSSKGNLVYPYQSTGIVAGKWVKEIVQPLFKKNKIEIDFSIRGFHDPLRRNKNKKILIRRIIDRLRSYY